MSELLYYLTPTPASVPIVTKGNAFYRDGERFFIKGISYIPLRPDVRPFHRGSMLDPLSDDRLDDLRQDVHLFHELGLNSISVQALDPSKGHSKALQLLEKEGIYVIVLICDSIEAPHVKSFNDIEFDRNFDPAPYYSPDMINNTFKLVDQLADHPNVLGFTVSGNVLNIPIRTKLAEVLRACVRDTKALLRARGGRQVLVGISSKNLMMIRLSQLQYFSAGEPEERADYFAADCWSWAGKSSFQISGWKNMVNDFEKTCPMPKFFNRYGTNICQPRIWEEVLCLYSPDMTGVFSGGVAYTFSDYAGRKYGVVDVGEDGRRAKSQDFDGLKEKFRVVNVRLPEEVFTADVKEYERWRGEFPQQQNNRWYASSVLPPFPGDWMRVLQDVIREPDWEVVERF